MEGFGACLEKANVVGVIDVGWKPTDTRFPDRTDQGIVGFAQSNWRAPLWGWQKRLIFRYPLSK